MATTFDTTIEQHVIDFIRLYLKDGYFVSAYLKENGWYKICATKVGKDKETEPLDKDTNVRSKYDCETCKHDLWHTPRMCGKCVRQEDGKPSMYESKTEPQTETSTNSEKVQLTDEPQTEDPSMEEYYKDHDEFYEPQTDCAWGKGEEK